MHVDTTVEMLAFNLKLIGEKTKKNVLISAGKMSDKEKMLPAITKLLSLRGVSLFATPGTSRFLDLHGIANQELYKIADRDKKPNIESFLHEDRFDLVINVLVGNRDYDEKSDSNLIRGLCIRNGIPLITDVDVAVLTIDEIVRKHRKKVYKYKISDEAAPWDMRKEFFQLVDKNGGFACYHAHFDKAYLISIENLKLSQVDMQKKWDLYKYLKENYRHEDLVERISRGVRQMVEQGVTHCRTFVDADSTVKLLPLEAALEVRAAYADQINLEIAVQPLQGVKEQESRRYFTEACERADIIGGLPSRDRPDAEGHLDYILALGRDLGKQVDVHIDQENNPEENETELLARKIIDYGMEGKVAGVHAISLAAKPEWEQERILGVVKDAGMSIIVCPSAALSMKQLNKVAPLHNSIAPLGKLLDHEISVYLGADNIHDLFMPLVDGDMYFEARLLMEACRYYDIERVAEIACDKDGFR